MPADRARESLVQTDPWLESELSELADVGTAPEGLALGQLPFPQFDFPTQSRSYLPRELGDRYFFRVSDVINALVLAGIDDPQDRISTIVDVHESSRLTSVALQLDADRAPGTVIDSL